MITMESMKNFFRY